MTTNAEAGDASPGDEQFRTIQNRVHQGWLIMLG